METESHLGKNNPPKELGEMCKNISEESIKILKEHITETAKNFNNIEKRLVVISDVMSGDARLVGLYCAVAGHPIVYIRDLSRLSNNHTIGSYFRDVGASVLTMAVEKSQTVYDAFKIPKMQIKIIKGASLTSEIAER